jgi:hypothetical protein
VHARQQPILVELLVAHPFAHVDDDGAAEQKRLELVGVSDRGRVDQVLVPALLLEGHEALVLLEAALLMQTKLSAGLPNLGMVTNEQFIHEDGIRVALGHAAEYLAMWRAHIARVDRQLCLVGPLD